MSFKGLYDKAKGWVLGRETTVQARPLATDAITHDSFDARLYEDLLTEVPALQKMVDDLNVRYGYTHDMVRDLLMQFWQGDPTLRSLPDMDPRYTRNHAVSTNVQQAPETPRTRTFTKHDKYGATMATLGVAQKVKDFLEEQDELDQKQKEQEEAQQQDDEEQDALNEALQALADAMGEHESPDGAEGPATEAQAAAEAAVDAALTSAQGAAEAADQALQDVQKAALHAQGKVNEAVREALVEVTEQLEEEEAMLRAWGLNDGDIKRMSFTERVALANRLRSNRLSKFAKMIGRRRIAAEAIRSRRTEYGRDEVVGVEMSGDIERVLPTEWAKSRHRALRLDFLQRFSEGALLSRKFVGIEKVRAGAIIGVCDNSQSMDKIVNGMSREAWAKAAMLCMLDQARTDGRDFVWINFSSAGQQQMWVWPKGVAPLDEVLEAAEQFFNGGTDVMVPLDMAMTVLENHPEIKGDITLLTDEECGVTVEWTHQYHARKDKLGFRLFGIAIGFDKIDGGVLHALSDEARAVMEFADPQDIAPLLKQL